MTSLFVLITKSMYSVLRGNVQILPKMGLYVYVTHKTYSSKMYLCYKLKFKLVGKTNPLSYIG